ncbi:hypothetical protein MSAN_01059900 [Mycena sanguinolenta]|uniref:Uncharacterized protein n=1 Tax=Mycena sanguinolenta TaxID=230812 RepID=A0A8H6YSE7_9AGAR|nr:hypothetical protein MSAN_01059900 [Mycena sanguinolenta]
MSSSNSPHEEETEAILENLCASARSSLQNPSWTFRALESMDPRTVSHFLLSLKEYWRPEDDTFEIPQEWSYVLEPFAEEPSLAPQTFALSLLSVTLFYIRTDLRFVPTSDFIARFESPDYRGPRFPLEDRRVNVVALFDLLVCDDSSTDSFLCLARCFSYAPGCQLKIDPQISFPSQLCTEPPPVGFACSPEWNCTSDSLEETGQDDGLTPNELMLISRAAQPHLEALLITWNQCHPKSPPGPTVCVFAIAFRPGHVFIVAHIPFPFYLPGTNDRKGFLARLRVVICLLTIQNHVSRAASLCQDVVWPAEIFDADLSLVYECTGIITPRPSEHEDSDAEFWGRLGDTDEVWLTGGEEVAEPSVSDSEIAHSKALVTEWLEQCTL